MKNKTESFCVNFYQTCHALPFPRTYLNTLVRTLYKNEKRLAKKEVNVVLCPDYTIKQLNRKYRGKNRPTDVLSFPFNEQNFLGEIYLSLERAAVQARRFNTTYKKEVGRLLVHGFVHLLGYDHETGKDRVKMEAVERKYVDL